MGMSIFFFVSFVIFAPKFENVEVTESDNAADRVVSEQSAQAEPVSAQAEPVSEAEPTTITPKAHGYIVVYARDHSISAKQRKGGLWYIVSDAETIEDRALTMVQAAKDLHSEMLEPTHAFIWLFSNGKAAEQGLGNVGTASYIRPAAQAYRV